MQYSLAKNFEEFFDINSIKTETSRCFDLTHCSFLSALSKEILKNPRARQYPDLITFGYFCRKANIERVLKDQLPESEQALRSGWGVCLHIAPANIPMNFAFSFLMGFLSGNSNIVRLPSKHFEQIDLFLNIFKMVADKNEYKPIANSNIFIRSDRDSSKLIDLVNEVDALIVWGGDETVERFRKIKKKPSCVDIYFPNRVSSLVINCDFILDLGQKDLTQLHQSFYNDTYLVDQNACSSPSLIIWYSNNKNHKIAKERFWKGLQMYLAEKYTLEPISLIEKKLDLMNFCCIANDEIHLEVLNNLIWTIDGPNYDGYRPKLGTFITKDIDSISELPELLRDEEQTLTYIGFDKKTLLHESLLSKRNRIDRLVPVGQALDIGLLWDGKDMIRNLSRFIEVR